MEHLGVSNGRVDGLRIDNVKFAREGRVIERKLALAGFERLSDLLVQREGEVSLTLTGQVTGDGPRSRLFLYLEASCDLVMTCTRCLEPLPVLIRIDSVFQLVKSESDIDQEAMEDDSKDHLVMDDSMSVLELLEDEILLALPVVPRHGSCGLPDGTVLQGKPSPFAVLAGLSQLKH